MQQVIEQAQHSPQKNIALIIRGHPVEETRRTIALYNAALMQTFDRLVDSRYESIYVLGHGHAIGNDPFYGYSTLLTRNNLERKVDSLREALASHDRLLTIVTGLEHDREGMKLPLYDRTSLREDALHALVGSIPAQVYVSHTL